MNILQAMADDALFGKVFKRSWLHGDSWRAWKSFLAALFALPLEGEQLELYRKHTARTDPPSSPASEAFIIAGRRSGKSSVGALIATYLACFRDYRSILSLGEQGVCMLLAADRKQAQVLFRYISAFFEIPLLSKMVVSRTKESIELDNQISVEVHTSDYRAVRGRTLVCCICDELSFWNWEASANPDSEVLTAVRPGLATTNGLLLGISSPYSKRGVLWENFRHHYGKDSDVLIWKGSSREMNPSLSPAVVAAAYLRDAATARAEFGGEFRDDVEGFLSLEVIESRMVLGRRELPPVAGVGYAAFCDPSGGASDSMTLGVCHVEKDKAVLDLLREVVPPFSPEAVVKEFCDTLRRYQVSEVRGDRYAGEWVAEEFSKRGVTYRSCEQSKSELYLEFLAHMNSGRIELLDNERLRSQLSGLERRTARGGKDSIDHAAGCRDDISNAVAGAAVEALRGAGGDYPLLELFRRGWSGFISDWRAEFAAGRAANSSNSDLLVSQEKAAPAAALAAPSPMFTGPAPPPCAACGSVCVVRIGTVWHCNQCGGDRWVNGAAPDVVVAGFDGAGNPCLRRR